tara:strand:+ start:404 stop:565 length:162 start_codon:yes stop_codon:yes gene_type:complete
LYVLLHVVKDFEWYLVRVRVRVGARVGVRVGVGVEVGVSGQWSVGRARVGLRL